MCTSIKPFFTIFHIILSDTKLLYCINSILDRNFSTLYTIVKYCSNDFSRASTCPLNTSLSKKNSLRECNQIVKHVQICPILSRRGTARWRYRDDVRIRTDRDRPSTHFEAAVSDMKLRKQIDRIDRNVWMTCDSIPHYPWIARYPLRVSLERKYSTAGCNELRIISSSVHESSSCMNGTRVRSCLDS